MKTYSVDWAFILIQKKPSEEGYMKIKMKQEINISCMFYCQTMFIQVVVSEMSLYV